MTNEMTTTMSSPSRPTRPPSSFSPRQDLPAKFAGTKPPDPPTSTVVERPRIASLKPPIRTISLRQQHHERQIVDGISARLRLCSVRSEAGAGATDRSSPSPPDSGPMASPEFDRSPDRSDPFFASSSYYQRRESDSVETDTLTTPGSDPGSLSPGGSYSFDAPAKGEGDAEFAARVRREFPFPAVDLPDRTQDDAIRMLGRRPTVSGAGYMPSPLGSPGLEDGPLPSPFSSPNPSTFQAGSPRPDLPASFNFGSPGSVPDSRGGGSRTRKEQAITTSMYGHADATEAQLAAKQGQVKYYQEQRAGGSGALRTSAQEDVGFMGSGSFGNVIRTKVAEVLERMCATVPQAARPPHDYDNDKDEDEEEEEGDGEVVSIVEYDAAGSRSASLIKPIIEILERRNPPSPRPDNNHISPSSSLETIRRPSKFNKDDRRHSRSSTCSSYVVTHASPLSTDTRPLSLLSESSYLDATWQAKQSPSLIDQVFSAYTTKAFGKAAVPRGTVSVGFSIMEMQKAFTARARGMSEVQHADAEFRAFLRARAVEFRRGGSLVLAFAVGRDKALPPTRPDFGRSFSYDAETGPSSASVTRRSSLPQSFEPSSPCLWKQLERIVAFAIRSLVTQGLINPVVAVAMEKLPLHSRTASQMRHVFSKVKDDWSIEWSCGLGSNPADLCGPNDELHKSLESKIESVEGPLRLSHPAQVAYENGAIGGSVWAEHAIALIRACYEPHCRAVLTNQPDPAGRELGRVEHVLEALWEDLEVRVANGALGALQLEVAVVGLRRL